MSAQGKVLPTTAALITDDETGGYIQITTPEDIDTHVGMLTDQGRSCTVWVRRTALDDAVVQALTEVALDDDADRRETELDAWRQR